MKLHLDEIISYAEICNLSYNTKVPTNFLNFKPCVLDDFDSTKVLILQNEEEICFTFRGSSSFYDIKQDLSFFKEEFIINNLKLGKVHDGFLNHYVNAKIDLFKILKSYLSTNTKCNRITLTGHSLGGSILLFGLEIIVLFPELQSKINIITFGSPKIGNLTFRNNCDDLISNNLRIVNCKDLVPKLPSRFLFYFHTTNELLLNKKTLFETMKISIKHIFYNISYMLNSFNDLIFNAVTNHGINVYISLLQTLNENKYKNLFETLV